MTAPLDVEEITTEDCYQRYTNPLAPHQLRIHWAKGKTECKVSCNCGAVFQSRLPQLQQMQAIKDEYALHVMQVVTR